MSETILIVDDEEPVRRTFREWLEGAHLGCTIYHAADAEEALKLANQHTIDLAILDWNLGAGNDGLQLLEDLYLFNSNIVAIMITGYAHQATPLDALRKGIRDYLDKNQDLTRESFLTAVRRQLERIRPAKREWQLHQSLLAFRESLEKVLPLVQSSAALNDPAPLPQAIRSLVQFFMHLLQARDGVLVVHGHDPLKTPSDYYQAYDADGQRLAEPLVPFSNSAASTACSMGQPCAMSLAGGGDRERALELQPFEQGRAALLAIPFAVSPGLQVVLELFDKESPAVAPLNKTFSESDQRLAGAAAEFGAELLRQSLAERQTQRVLLDAVAAALTASESVTEALRGTPAQRLDQPPPESVLASVRQALESAATTPLAAEATVRLAEAIRVLSLRHGEAALRHCARVVEDLKGLLDAVAGYSEESVRPAEERQ